MRRNYIQCLIVVTALFFIAVNGLAQENPVKEILTRLLEARIVPDWDDVHTEYRKVYPDRDADSLTIYTKMQYFLVKKDEKKFMSSLMDYGNKYGENWTPNELNSYAWMAFKYSNDPQKLQMALSWSKRSLSGEKTEKTPFFLDTYANLLYKLGNKKEAIQYEGKALSMFPDNDPYLSANTGKLGYGLNKKQAMYTLFKMERGMPTWPVSEENTTVYKQTSSLKDDQYWQRIKDKWLSLEYSLKKTDSMLYLGKLYTYDKMDNKPAYITEFIAYVEKYENSTIEQKNNNAWEVFLYSKDKKELKQALSWSTKAIKDMENKNRYLYLDTYADLLYKLGKKSKAIRYKKEALKNCPEKQRAAFQTTLDKMIRDEKTWE